MLILKYKNVLSLTKSKFIMFFPERQKNIFLKKDKEFVFKPRIINPVRIKKTAILSADEQIRNAGKILKTYMPWIQVELLTDPISASNFESDEATVFLLDDTALMLVDHEKLKQNNKDIVLVLLSSNELIQCSPPSVAEEKYAYSKNADLIFAVNNSEFVVDNIITAAVRCAEDKLNIEKYSKARRFIFLIVDDEPRWFSEFLPTLYKIIGQRADVMVARTFEKALKFLFDTENFDEIDATSRSKGHGDDVVCLITDIFFPRNDQLESDAGRDLVKIVNRIYPRIPIIIASKAKQADDLREIAYLMPKGDPGSLNTLSQYIHHFTGLGDFLIRDKSGKEHYRIKDIRELYDIILKADRSTKKTEKLRQFLDSYGEKDYFSTWLYMHGFRELGDVLRPRRDIGHRLVTVLKRILKREILKLDRTPLIIEEVKINSLTDFFNFLKNVEPTKIQYYSDNDIFSNWLDRKGFPELAEEFRPVHGSGSALIKNLAALVEKWLDKYGQNNTVK